MATTATPSTWKAPAHAHSNSRSSRPLTTPRTTHPVATSATTHMKSQLSPNVRSPPTVKDVNTTSPSYFGFVVGDDSIPGDSGPGPHARQNWNDGSRSASRPMNNERNPDFELFRRQSEKNMSFALNTLPQARSHSSDALSPNRPSYSPISPTNTSFRSPGWTFDKEQTSTTSQESPFFLGVQRQDSPLTMSPRSSVTDAKNARLSLPTHETQSSSEAQTQRSDTLPPQMTKEVTAMMSPQEVARVIEQYTDKTVILDLRVYPQYAASRVRGALNLCIPTTLLKRPAFTVQKLADTFTSDEDKAKFSRWRTAQYIIVYDAASSLAKEAITCLNVLKKFMTEGWKGTGLVVKGGFANFQKLVPKMVDTRPRSPTQGSSESTLSTSPSSPPKLPVAGGCQMPATKNAANPFFGNIRQNMDLLDGVGQLPIGRPKGMQEGEEKRLPTWLKKAVSIANEGKDVSNKFLGIERTEQQRMQKALSANVSYGSPGPNRSNEVQVAGIEKGSKNRYNNIFPFEHSRVKLQNVPTHGCDYINASFVKANYTNRRYIATQAPIPQTFDDFWRVIWEQDVRVIVMLTAESEGGQVKSHPYWKSGEYGPLKVKLLSEKTVPLVPQGNKVNESVQKRPSAVRRLTTSNATPAVEKKFNFEPAEVRSSGSKGEEEPSVTIRHFTIAHSSQPFTPMRDVTQVQYAQWPDFGAPASPKSILSLIDIVNKYQQNAMSPIAASAPNEPAKEGQRPIVVHCSAGCGRTGTFCTIDSVIDMLKQQRLHRQASPESMDIDRPDDWVRRDDIDLVAKAVEDFRRQRLSMVQNLRQFVLCYESILQWFHDHR